MTPFLMLLIAAAGDPSPAPVEPARYETAPAAPAPITPIQAETRLVPATARGARPGAVEDRRRKPRAVALRSPRSVRRNALRGAASNTTERAAVTAIAERIERFASISRRHRNLAATADGWRRPNRVAQSRAGDPSGRPPGVTPGPQSAADQVLRQLASRRDRSAAARGVEATRRAQVRGRRRQGPHRRPRDAHR